MTMSESPAAPTTPEPAPGRRNEWLLVGFTGSTTIAGAVIKVTLPLLAVQATRSPALIAAVATMLTLPWLLTALHVGVYVDRMNRRTLMVAAEVARLVSVGLLLLAVGADAVGLPLIFATALALGVSDVVALISGASIVPSAVPKARWQAVSVRITGLEYLCGGFVGVPVGGFLVAAGFAIALGTTGAVYVVGVLLLTMLAGNFRAAAVDKPRQPVRVEIREGLQFLWSHRLLRTMALLITVMAGCWSGWIAILPGYAVGGPLGLDARQYGFLLTCLGAGGVLGTLLVGPVNRLLGRRWSMFIDIVGSFLLVAIPAVLPAAPSSAWVIAAAAFVAGAGGTMWTVNSRVITQSFVPQELLGRFHAASRLVAWGMTPIAAAVAGTVAQLVSYRAAFGLFAVCCLLLVYPFLRAITAESVAEVDRPAPAEPVPATAGAPS
jgi:MFS family permease